MKVISDAKSEKGCRYNEADVKEEWNSSRSGDGNGLWRRLEENQMFGAAASSFIRFLKNAFQAL